MQFQQGFCRPLQRIWELGFPFKIVQAWGKEIGTWYPCNNLQAALGGAWPWMRSFSSTQGNSSGERLGCELHAANRSSSWGISVVQLGSVAWAATADHALCHSDLLAFVIACLLIRGNSSSSLLSFPGKFATVRLVKWTTIPATVAGLEAETDAQHPFSHYSSRFFSPSFHYQVS